MIHDAMAKTRRTIRLSDDFWEGLRRKAVDEGSTRTDLIRKAVEEVYGIEDNGKDESD